MYAWGYNAYGELGVGDVDLRLQPTLLSGPLQQRIVTSASCGDRHTLLCCDYRPRQVQEDKSYRPYFTALASDPSNDVLKGSLRRDMRMNNLNPDFLNTPDAPMPNQIGATLASLPADRFEKGLRYCLDTTNKSDFDWRRGVYETTFECSMLNLRAICLACARICKKKFKLRPCLRKRGPGNDTCDCRTSGLCECKYTIPRAAFDLVCGEDGFIAPHQLRSVLQALRAPLLVEGVDMEVGLLALAKGVEEKSDIPRISPIAFEQWYEGHYDNF